jgi:group I intron endonuclease
MRKISTVYSIVHIVSGKPYIGSAIDADKRFSEHKFDLIHNHHDNLRLQNAWNKYGSDAFEFKILEEVLDPANLLEREQYWMDKLRSYDRAKGFNIRKKAESNFGLKHTPETRKKMSENGKGKHNNFGENNPFFGKTHDQETIAKMRKPKSEEGKTAIKIARLEWSKTRYKETICLVCKNPFKQRLCENKKLCSKSCRGKYLRNIQLGIKVPVK